MSVTKPLAAVFAAALLAGACGGTITDTDQAAPEALADANADATGAGQPGAVEPGGSAGGNDNSGATESAGSDGTGATEPGGSDGSAGGNNDVPVVAQVATADALFAKARTETEVLAEVLESTDVTEPDPESLGDVTAKLLAAEEALDADKIRAVADDKPALQALADAVDDLDQTIIRAIAVIANPDEPGAYVIAVIDTAAALEAWEAVVEEWARQWEAAVAEWEAQWAQAAENWEAQWAQAAANWEAEWEEAAANWEAQWQQAAANWEAQWAQAAENWEAEWAEAAENWEAQWAQAAADWEAQWEEAAKKLEEAFQQNGQPAD